MRPVTLLPTNQVSDFSRNFLEMEHRAKQPYSLTKVIRSLSTSPYKLDGFEVEINQELKALNPGRNVNGILVPIESLSPSRRDLTVSGAPVVVQTTVEPEIIPFLRAKSVCGRLGAQLIDGLVSGNLGNLKLPRANLGGVASWQPEKSPGPDADPNFDTIALTPKRITGSTVLSRQLILQSSPDIEAFVANDLATAIGVAVDNAALNGTGTAPQPLGILHYPVNASGSYTYSSRSANVTFGGPASWASVLSFEKILEQGLVSNDGSYGYCVDPTVRDKWQQTAKLTGYPSFLWENLPDDPDFGRVNGRKAISSTQLPAGQVIFGKWSELLVCTWLGVEVFVDPFSLATAAEVRVRVSLLADIGFRYALAFCASADSGAQ
jgi:HK97 family phage major capsid protein